MPFFALGDLRYVAISMGGYEYLKRQLGDGSPSPMSKLFCGWASGLCGSLFCYPLDTVKRRVMLDGTQGFQVTRPAG